VPKIYTSQALFLVSTNVEGMVQTMSHYIVNHREMVGDMSRLTLEFDLSKIPPVYF